MALTKIRHYTSGDYEKFLSIYETALPLRSKLGRKTSEIFETQLKRPGYHPEKNLYIAENSKGIIAFVNIIEEKLIKRIILEAYVAPRSRRKRVASKLFKHALKKGKDNGAKTAHVSISENNRGGALFLKRTKFSLVRCFLEMELDLAEIPPQKPSDFINKTTHFSYGDEEKLKDLQNRVFNGSWGFCANTTEEIKYYLDLTGCKISDILTMKSSSEMAAYIWAHDFSRRLNSSWRKKGRIHMVGVLPEYRGQGLGKKILISGIEALRKKGSEVIELTVDKDNASAYSLYSSLGFKTVKKSFWYEKKI
jgi:mycothiol synthase